MNNTKTKKVGYPEGKPWSVIRRTRATIRFKKTHIEKLCIQCGLIFSPFISEIKKVKRRGQKGGQFCSKKCHSLSMIGKKRPEKVRVSISKGRIGMKFSESHRKALRQTYLNGRVPTLLGKVFSEKHREGIALGKIGEKNPNWNGGVSFFPYPIIFNSKLKKQIKERDGYVCLHCGKTEEEELIENKKRLAIHHIDYNKMNCDPSNLVTVCNSANSLANFNRNYWTNFFQQKLCDYQTQ